MPSARTMSSGRWWIGFDCTDDRRAGRGDAPARVASLGLVHGPAATGKVDGAADGAGMDKQGELPAKQPVNLLEPLIDVDVFEDFLSLPRVEGECLGNDPRAANGIVRWIEPWKLLAHQPFQRAKILDEPVPDAPVQARDSVTILDDLFEFGDFGPGIAHRPVDIIDPYAEAARYHDVGATVGPVSYTHLRAH